MTTLALRVAVAALALVASSVGYAQSGAYRQGTAVVLPDPKLTPGLANPAVYQSNIAQTICKPGWTETVRPPVSYTDKLKLQLMKLYGDTVPQKPTLGNPADVRLCVARSNDPRCYELDHLESLEIGGHPTDRRNLWPQPYWPKPAAHEKDAVETWLKGKVCSGEFTLEIAQQAIAHQWYHVYLEMKHKGAK